MPPELIKTFCHMLIVSDEILSKILDVTTIFDNRYIEI